MMRRRLRSLWLLLLFLVVSRGDDADGCRRGFRRGTLAPYAVRMGQCSPCPPGMECDTGQPCASDTLALPASGRCCARNQTCPPGRVLDNTLCLCAPLGCAAAEERLLLLLLPGGDHHARHPSRLACRSPLDHPIPPESQRCSEGLALDPLTGACIAVSPCTVAVVAAGGGATRWRGGDGRLECVAWRSS
jgi:hypothetical protein